MVPGSWFLVPGTRCTLLLPLINHRFLVPGSWFLEPGAHRPLASLPGPLHHKPCHMGPMAALSMRTRGCPYLHHNTSRMLAACFVAQLWFWICVANLTCTAQPGLHCQPDPPCSVMYQPASLKHRVRCALLAQFSHAFPLELPPSLGGGLRRDAGRPQMHARPRSVCPICGV
jgi:hypothetical protein